IGLRTALLDHIKNCLGALDGTHVKVRTTIVDQPKYRNRKGSYYLCDAGYANREGFLTPFRGQRYHLREWGPGSRPNTSEEYYNMKHSSARNVIERTFGILKM
ncbi:hypothetical protein LINPERHAP2_LOCUS23356, partial [Linum perenne]